MHSSTNPHSLETSPCFNLKVFYVKLSNCTELYKSAKAAEHLSLNLTPLSPVEVNGPKNNAVSVSSSLRRNRVDKRSKEAIFVSTDSIRMSGSMKFEVYGRGKLMLCGVFEKSMMNEWSMNCDPVLSGGFYFMEGKKFVVISEFSWPAIEVYVTGFFSGSDIILTKTIYLGKKNETEEAEEKVLPMRVLELMKYEGFAPEVDVQNNEYECIERRSVDYSEVENGEISLFNAGVGVGVGIALSICLCIGIGTSLLFRTYNTTCRNFWRLL